MITKTSSCPTCGYPIAVHIPRERGRTREEEITCAYCGEHLIASGVTIPTPVFVGLIMFAIGVFIGPALVSSTAAGQKWLEQYARR